MSGVVVVFVVVICDLALYAVHYHSCCHANDSPPPACPLFRALVVLWILAVLLVPHPSSTSGVWIRCLDISPGCNGLLFTKSVTTSTCCGEVCHKSINKQGSPLRFPPTCYCSPSVPYAELPQMQAPHHTAPHPSLHTYVIQQQ